MNTELICGLCMLCESGLGLFAYNSKKTAINNSDFNERVIYFLSYKVSPELGSSGLVQQFHSHMDPGTMFPSPLMCLEHTFQPQGTS